MTQALIILPLWTRDHCLSHPERKAKDLYFIDILNSMGFFTGVQNDASIDYTDFIDPGSLLKSS